MPTPDEPTTPKPDAIITMDDWRPWHVKIGEVATPTEEEPERGSAVYLVR